MINIYNSRDTQLVELGLAEAANWLFEHKGLKRNPNTLRQAIKYNRRKPGTGLAAVNTNPDNPRRGELRVTIEALEAYAERAYSKN